MLKDFFISFHLVIFRRFLRWFLSGKNQFDICQMLKDFFISFLYHFRNGFNILHCSQPEFWYSFSIFVQLQLLCHIISNLFFFRFVLLLFIFLFNLSFYFLFFILFLPWFYPYNFFISWFISGINNSRPFLIQWLE